MKNIIARIMQPYADSSYELRGRVRAFIQLNMALVPILVVFIIIMNILIQRGLFQTLNVLVGSILIVIGVSVLLTARGLFNPAIIVFIIVTLAGLGFNMRGTDLTGSGARFIGASAALSLPILLCTLFSTRWLLVAATALAQAIMLAVMAGATSIPPEIKPVVTGTLSIIIILTGVIGYIINRINDTARRLRMDDTLRERERHLAINESLLESLKEVSRKLDDSSHQLSSNSALFLDNIQSQASSIEEITATIEEISSGSESVSDSMEEQSAAMESLARLIGELTAITGTMEARITDSLAKTKEIARRAQAGETHIMGMSRSMEEINDTARQMTGILNIINDISDRINLLSLNASIEAARAGEHGRGFAVVADEIGKLADQTSTSVKEIDALIKKSEQEIGRGLVTVQDTVETMRGIIEGVNVSNNTISDINASMDQYVKSNDSVRSETDRAKQRSDEIKTAMLEQKKAAEEIVGTITGVNNISQENAISAEEIKRQAEMIADMALDLRDKISKFDEEWVDAPAERFGPEA
ncbi:MAG TPA: methyl-accepting chemotaxis protein [Spirochaetota bacterium]|nr:methyl-accepting chemotaxis protein [Spirochaetota bacterium]